MSGYEPDYRLTGGAAPAGRRTVHFLTTLPGEGCVVVETRVSETRQVEWLPCGLPAFARVYAGDVDVVEDATEDEPGVVRDLEPRVCWRHLLELGASREIVVRPWSP